MTFDELFAEHNLTANERASLVAHLAFVRSAATVRALTAPSQAPQAPMKAIGNLLEAAMSEAVRNGTNSVSMPDEYVEIAGWLAGIASSPQAPQVERLTDEQAMRAVVNACDSLNITRVHELGGKTMTICDEAGLLEIARAVEAAIQGAQK